MSVGSSPSTLCALQHSNHDHREFAHEFHSRLLCLPYSAFACALCPALPFLACPALPQLSALPCPTSAQLSDLTGLSDCGVILHYHVTSSYHWHARTAVMTINKGCVAIPCECICKTCMYIMQVAYVSGVMSVSNQRQRLCEQPQLCT